MDGFLKGENDFDAFKLPERSHQQQKTFPAFRPVSINNRGQTYHFPTITFMKEYSNMSFEEIAWYSKQGLIRVQPSNVPWNQLQNQQQQQQQLNWAMNIIQQQPPIEQGLRFPFADTSKPTSVAATVSTSPYGKKLPELIKNEEIKEIKSRRRGSLPRPSLPLSPNRYSPSKRKNESRYSESELHDLENAVASPAKVCRVLTPDDRVNTPISPRVPRKIELHPVAGISQEVLNAGSPEDELPKLTKSGYFMRPSVEDMSLMSRSQLERIDLVVGHQEHGEIAFSEVNVIGLDLDEIVEIDHGFVDVYPSEKFTQKVRRGEGLNKPAVVTLRNVKPEGGLERQQESRYIETLKKQNELCGAEFIYYSIARAEWSFKI
jgi:hypothetical protein